MKRIKIGLLLVATAALVAGTAGSASALSFTATSLVQENNDECGLFVVTEPINGSAKFTRTFNKLKVTYKAKHLAKSTFYELRFFNATAGACQSLGSAALFITSPTGTANVTAELEVPEGDNAFFVDGETTFSAPFNNDSFVVTLPRP